MKQTKETVVSGLVTLVSLLWLLPSVGGAATKVRTCGPQPGHTIEQFLKELSPGDTLLLNGSCNENVVIPEEVHRITLDGQGTATINGPDATQNTVRVRGTGITIMGFTITGGRSGVSVQNGGTATIDGNVIQNTGQHGISVTQGSTAVIVNNTIQNNPEHGISIGQSSSANIGFRSPQDTAASPNLIQNNGSNGINVSDSGTARIDGNMIQGNTSGINVSDNSSARIGFSGVTGSFTAANTIQNNANTGVSVSGSSHAGLEGNTIANNAGAGVSLNESSSVDLGFRGTTEFIPNTIQNNGSDGVVLRRASSARIVGETISNNGGNGVQIARGSQADVANSVIDANAADGVLVTENSGVNLGNPTGTTNFDLPNSGSNGGVGIRCRIAAYGNGRRGTLTGAGGVRIFGTTLTVITVDGASSNWGPVLDGDGTTLAVNGNSGSVIINNEGCVDRTTP
jgi:parallel beta-helix repeat protein